MEYFYSAVSDYVGDGTDPLRAVCAVGITDYLSIENYWEVMKHKRLPECIKLVLPNVEMRITPIAKERPVNIHCIFSPDIAEELNERFFARLEFNYNYRPYGATREELIRLGKAHTGDGSLSDETALKKGIEQFVIPFESLRKIFEQDSDLRKNTIIALPNDTKDGASGVSRHSDYLTGNSSQMDATLREIYRFSDVIFSSNKKDIEYFLGEGRDSPETVKSRYRSLKPCIHGCDAHSEEKIFSPDQDRFCWIKADPTFEGLRQILYEPKERVRISSTIPEDKPAYYVIDRVEVTGCDKFSPEPVYFNSGLNCIIGGKSTGKSLLLHNIAAAVDSGQAQKKAEIASVTVKPVTGFKVFWRDNPDSNATSSRKIVYIPQSYLNRLVDNEQETTEIDAIIRDIILQDRACEEAYSTLNKNISGKKQELAHLAVRITEIYADICRLQQEYQDNGDIETISAEINRLNDQIKKLNTEYGMTEGDITLYHNALEQQKILQTKTETLNTELSKLNEIVSVAEFKTDDSLNFHVLNGLFTEALRKVKEAADSAWRTQKEELFARGSELMRALENGIKEISAIANDLSSGISASAQINSLSVKIQEETRKLSRSKELNERITALKAEYDQKKELLSRTFEYFSRLYDEYTEHITKSKTNDGNLEFYVKKVFRAEKFSQKILDILNQKYIRKFEALDINSIKEEDLTPANISCLTEAIITGVLQVKAGYSAESALREILNDWYNVNYIVKLDNDEINSMSQGKKALVLLRLLISLENSKFPILIDQPEDDLDNRSIFDELVNFIKARKADRQIIIVTHNANIVLGADAEQVIVANQDGINTPNTEYRFEYRSGAIEDNTTIPGSKSILGRKNIKEHICEILEGGEQAFGLRQSKYHFAS